MSWIFDAGGIAGNAKDRQPWRFLVLGDHGLVEEVAQTICAPPNVLGGRAADRSCGQRQGSGRLDVGRAA